MGWGLEHPRPRPKRRFMMPPRPPASSSSRSRVGKAKRPLSVKSPPTTSEKTPRELETGKSRIVPATYGRHWKGRRTDGDDAGGLRHVLLRAAPRDADVVGLREPSVVVGVLYWTDTSAAPCCPSPRETLPLGAVRDRSGDRHRKRATLRRVGREGAGYRDLKITAEIQRNMLPEPSSRDRQRRSRSGIDPCLLSGATTTTTSEIGERGFGSHG